MLGDQVIYDSIYDIEQTRVGKCCHCEASDTQWDHRVADSTKPDLYLCVLRYRNIRGGFQAFHYDLARSLNYYA